MRSLPSTAERTLRGATAITAGLAIGGLATGTAVANAPRREVQIARNINALPKAQHNGLWTVVRQVVGNQTQVLSFRSGTDHPKNREALVNRISIDVTDSGHNSSNAPILDMDIAINPKTMFETGSETYSPISQSSTAAMESRHIAFSTLENRFFTAIKDARLHRHMYTGSNGQVRSHH